MWVNCGRIVVGVGIRVVKADARGGWLRRAHGGRWQLRSYGSGTVSATVTPPPPDDSVGSGPWVLSASPASWPQEVGAFGEPACSAAEGESRWRPPFTGGVGAAWIPGGNGLRQQPQPDLVPFRRAAGEGVKSVSVFGKRQMCRAGARNRLWRSFKSPRPT